MLTLTHRPITPVSEEPTSATAGRASEKSAAAAADPADNYEEPRTFLRILLRALGAMHT